MQSTTLATLVVLAPLLALVLGLVVAVLVGAWRARATRWACLVATALALGAVAKLWLLARTSPFDLALTGPVPLILTTLDVHFDLARGLAAITVLILGLCAFAAAPGEDGQSRGDYLATLVALLAALALTLTTDLLIVSVAWTALVAIGVLALIAARRTDEAAAWIVLGVCGAPALLVGGALLQTTRAAPSGAAGVSAEWTVLLLAIVGAVSAGITPLAGWLERSPGSGAFTFIADAALPVVGFSLAVRATGLVDPTNSLGLSAVLIAAGLWGIADAADAAWSSRDPAATGRAAGRGEIGMAFVALAIGTQTAVAAGLFLVVVSVVARAIPRVNSRGLIGRIAWASGAGLPPLPGFLGRWLIVMAALAAGAWLLGIAIGLGCLVLDLGLLGGTPNPGNHPEPSPDTGKVLAGLLLLLAIVPASAFTGHPGPAIDPVARLLALIIVLIPPLVATALARPRPAPRRATTVHRERSRGWESIEQIAERAAEASRIVEGRYNLAFGFLVAIVAIFALVG